MHHAYAFLILFAFGLAIAFFAGYCRGNRDGELIGFRRGVARASRLRGGSITPISVKMRVEETTSGPIPTLPEIPPDRAV